MPIERRPDLFIVGAQKSGTSTLANWLRDHPQTFMSYPKEPGFLAFGAEAYPYLDGYGNASPASHWVVDNISDYMALFKKASVHHQVVAEASTWYLAVPGTADSISKFDPQAKIIIILRNPVDRAYSAWSHARRDGLEPLADFKTALDAEHDRSEPEFLLRYHAMGLYSEQVAAYQACFPAKQLFIALYDDLKDNPEQLKTRLYKFLGLPLMQQTSGQRQYNKSGMPKSRLLQSLLCSRQFRNFWRWLLPEKLAVWIKFRIDQLNLQSLSPMDPAARAYLQDYYRTDVTRLMTITGKDLSSWLQ